MSKNRSNFSPEEAALVQNIFSHLQDSPSGIHYHFDIRQRFKGIDKDLWRHTLRKLWNAEKTSKLFHDELGVDLGVAPYLNREGKKSYPKAFVKGASNGKAKA